MVLESITFGHLIQLSLAKKLKENGLNWTPRWHDFFAVPAFEERVFILSDMMAEIQLHQGGTAITFNGAVEWSLDYVWQIEAIWLPTESQLRHLLQTYLAKESQPAVGLTCYPDQYLCQIQYRKQSFTFTGVEASDVYGEALLAILKWEADSKK